MCGIAGYVGKKSALKPVIDGLRALEYRGYDSAGIAKISDGKTIIIKQTGSVDNLERIVNKNKSTSHIAIGHTRWATHGVPSTNNSHPHTNSSQTISVVHNGIIENFQAIKEKLEQKDYKFISETDTEVIPHLIDFYTKNTDSFEEAFVLALKELRGAYAIAVINNDQPDKVFVAKLSSPLVIGMLKDGHIIASDATAILDKTKKVIYLDDFEYAVVSNSKVKIHNMKTEKAVKHVVTLLSQDSESAKLGEFKHFMIKEIFETPDTVRSASRGRLNQKAHNVKLGGLSLVSDQLRFIDRIVIVACGTSYYAGMVGEYLIEEIADIPVEVQLASEFKYRDEPFSRSTAVLAISQSGETADTIAALKKVEQYGVLKLGIVNVVGSTIARLTDAGVYAHAGPELSVASTKAFVAQVTVLAELALYLSKNLHPDYKQIITELGSLPEKIEELLKTSDDIKKVAKKFSNYRDFLYIGRGYNYPAALEGALKLKEVSYIHAEGYAAGEMKHGPLAMIDKNFPTFAVATDDGLKEKVLSNIQEIKARSGPIVAIATKGDTELNKLTKNILYIPKCIEQVQPILNAIVMQLFAYHVAVEKNLNVDRPRNLAKSVTVE